MDILEKEILKEFLSEFDDGEQLGYKHDADNCSKCGKSVNAVYHYHFKDDVISDFMYCENCNENWGSAWEHVFKHLYMYFVDSKELFCIKRENMFIKSSAYGDWKMQKMLKNQLLCTSETSNPVIMKEVLKFQDYMSGKHNIEKISENTIAKKGKEDAKVK